jgi:hypothetical protein
MNYYRYTFAEHGRHDGYTGSVTGYYEIAPDLSFVRSLEVFEDGIAYSFDLEHAADTFGILPDTEMDVEAAREIGDIEEIGGDEFERLWKDTAVINRETKSYLGG